MLKVKLFCNGRNIRGLYDIFPSFYILEILGIFENIFLRSFRVDMFFEVLFIIIFSFLMFKMQYNLLII